MYATSAGQAGTALKATSAGEAGTAYKATSAGNAGTAGIAGTSSYATSSGNSGTAYKATSAGNAGTAGYYDISTYVNPKGMAQGVQMTYAASGLGATGITVADNDNIDFGTGDFTLVWRGSLPDWSPTGLYPVLIQKYQSAADRWMFGLYSDTKLVFHIYKTGETVTTYETTIAPSTVISDGAIAEIAVVVTRQSASVAGSVVYYINGVLFQSVTIPVGTPLNISNTGPIYVSGSYDKRNASVTQFAATFNRALTAAEVLDLYRNGINYNDKWGSQTSEKITDQNNRDFSSGTIGDWLAEGNCTVSYDAGPAGEKVGKFAATDSAATAKYAKLLAAKMGTFRAGSRIRIKCDVYIPSGQTSTGNIQIGHGGTLSDATLKSQRAATGTTTDVWQPLWIEYTLGDDVTLNIYLYCYWANSGDYFYFDNASVIEIGATLALEPEGINDTNWQDSSSNNLDASYPAAGWSLTRLSGFAGTAGYATSAGNSGTAYYATSAGQAGTAVKATSAGNAGSASYASTSAIAGTAPYSGTSSYATSSGQAGTSVKATSAGEAGTSMKATSAGNAGSASYASTAAIAGTSPYSGTASYATTSGQSGTAVYATSSGNSGTAYKATSAGESGTALLATTVANGTSSYGTCAVLFVEGTAGTGKAVKYDEDFWYDPVHNTLNVSAISASGAISFFAQLTSSQDNVTGDNTEYPITGAIWTEVWDTAGAFSNGTFTAPVTGKYVFSGVISLVNANADAFNSYLKTSNRTHNIAPVTNAVYATNWGFIDVPFCVIADMDSGDTAYLSVKLDFAAHGKITDVSAVKFYGYLLP